MPVSVYSLWWLLLPAAVMLIGAVLLWMSWRGKKVDDHPLCRRCRFDLTGTPEAATCPECGAAVGAQAQRRVGNRRRRPITIYAAIMLLLIGVAGGAGVGWSYATSINQQQSKPVWLLRREAKKHGTPLSSAALTELQRRLSAGLLSQQQVDDVTADALKVQADASISWEPMWGEFVEQASIAGLLSQNDLDRYAQRLVDDALVLELRPRVRRGDPLPFRLMHGAPRLGDPQNVRIIINSADFMIGRKAIADGRGISLPSPLRSLMSGYGSGGFTSSLPLDGTMLLAVPDGAQPVVLRCDVTVYVARSGQSAHVDLRLPGGLTLSSTEEMTAEPVVDSLLRQAMRAAFAVHVVELRQSGDAVVLHTGLNVRASPIDVACDVIARDVYGREWRVGAIDHSSGQPYSRMHSGAAVVAGFDLSTISIELRPSYDVAVSTTDIVEYWGEPIVFEDVPVGWSYTSSGTQPVQSEP